MAGSLTEFFIVESSGNLMSPKSRSVYPELFVATQVKRAGKFKFRLTLLIPKAVDLTLIRKLIEDCATDNLGKKKATTKWRNPLIKVADEPRFADKAAEYPWMIRPNSDNKPQVILPNKTVVDSADAPDEVYGGRWMRASMTVYWYSGEKQGGMPGVGLGLSNVQLLDHDDPVGGNRVAASSEFDEVDETELADMEE